MKKLLKSALASLAIAGAMTTGALAAGGGNVKQADIDFPFEGPFGVYDRAALQRGLQVYQNSCSGCHGMKYVAFRSLSEENGPGMSPEQVKAFIAEAGYEVEDENGELVPAKTYDYFPEVKDAGAPDMSLLAKARPNGPTHIYSILTGFADPPECAPEDFDGNYNIAFGSGGIPDECKDEAGKSTIVGSWIAMGQPLYGDDVEYADGREASLENEAADVAQFLMWAAEPTLVERKQAGVRNILFLIIFAVMLYFVKQRIWGRVKHPE